MKDMALLKAMPPEPSIPKVFEAVNKNKERNINNSRGYLAPKVDLKNMYSGIRGVIRIFGKYSCDKNRELPSLARLNEIVQAGINTRTLPDAQYIMVNGEKYVCKKIKGNRLCGD